MSVQIGARNEAGENRKKQYFWFKSGISRNVAYLPSGSMFGGLAQLARALAWHARGRRFDPDTLHALKVPKGAFLVMEL